MVMMAMGQDHLPDPGEILPHAPGIVEQSKTLAGIEKERLSPHRFQKGGKTMLADCPCNRSDTVVTKDRYPHPYFPEQVPGNLGTPSLPRRLNMGQNWVNPDWNRFSPTKPVNQSQYWEWKWARSSDTKTKVPAIILTTRST
jgi:hypothetical protein